LLPDVVDNVGSRRSEPRRRCWLVTVDVVDRWNCDGTQTGHDQTHERTRTQLVRREAVPSPATAALIAARLPRGVSRRTWVTRRTGRSRNSDQGAAWTFATGPALSTTTE
jgi:hypothetical protein